MTQTASNANELLCDNNTVKTYHDNRSDFLRKLDIISCIDKLYWIDDQLADVSTRFYTSASWRRRVGPSASWLVTVLHDVQQCDSVVCVITCSIRCYHYIYNVFLLCSSLRLVNTLWLECFVWLWSPSLCTSFGLLFISRCCQKRKNLLHII